MITHKQRSFNICGDQIGAHAMVNGHRVRGLERERKFKHTAVTIGPVGNYAVILIDSRSAYCGFVRLRF